MAQKPTPKKTVAEDPHYAQALQSYESGLRFMQEHKFDKAKPHFQKVLSGGHNKIPDSDVGRRRRSDTRNCSLASCAKARGPA